MDDDGKNRFDALMQLANFRREIRGGRVTTFWLVKLAIWGSIAAAATTAHGHISYVVLIPAGLLVVAADAFWIIWNDRAAERSAAWMYYFLESAEHELFPDQFKAPKLPQENNPPTTNVNPPKWHFSEHPPSAFALALTIIVVGIAILMMAN